MARKRTAKSVENVSLDRLEKIIDNTPSERAEKAFGRIEMKTGRPLTVFQRNILKWVIDEDGHAVVNAVAGSGKTTILEYIAASLTYGTERPSMLMLAFNKSIANELTARMPQNCTCKTLNGLGHGILMNGLKAKPILDTDKTEIVAKHVSRFDEMTPETRQSFLSMLNPIKRIVSLFKGAGFGAILPLPNVADANEIIDRHGIDLDDEIEMDVFYRVLFDTYEECLNNTRLIDFDDQLFLPIKLGISFPSYYKFVMIDESQDLNSIQIEMVRRIKGRKIFVGDRFQSIYGFRGADPESIDRIVGEFSATELPLSTTFRCPVAVVEAAKKYVPHIEAAPNAKEGKVGRIKEEDLIDTCEDGDFIICRTSAPLADACMDLIRAGKKATIMGSDIGERLNSMLKKVAKRKYSGGIWEQIKEYKEAEICKLDKPGQESKCQRLADQLDTLLVLAEDCETSADVERKIRRIFSDNVRGITLMTGHKSKGLEPSKDSKVFIIHPELMPHPMAKKAWEKKQEINLLYVAITRATNELHFVVPKKEIRFGNR